MPSVTRRTSSTRSARRALIVASMLEVVEEALEGGETYTELSVERLITAADISRSTFYVYFEDKGSLLLALAQDVVEKLIVAGTVWWDLPAESEKEELGEALRGIIDVYREHASMWGALIDGASYDPKVRASFREIVEATTKEITRHIRDGQRAGYVREGLDPRRTAAWLTWMTERGLYQLLPGACDAEVAELGKAQTAIVWYTLYEGARNRGGDRSQGR